MSTFLRRFLLAAALVAGLALPALAQQKPAAAPQLQHFPTADAAATALTEAIRKDDDKSVAAILGAGWRDLVSGNKTHEDDVRQDKVMVEVGTTGWLMPIPIVKDASGWSYDVEAGRKEIQARDIGRDELTAIQTLLAIVDAQGDYAALDPMKTGVATYARRLLSSPGKKDGLYWEAKPGEPESPLGPLVAKAQPGDREGEGYFGYHYRLLYGQGPAAPGGAYSYLVNNRMIGGFGVIAWPVTYGETGVMTFIVSQSGDVYEQDLGPETTQRAAAITLFNPDKGWEKADMTPP